MIDEKDKEFEGIVRILKGLQQVKAPNNFETNLMRRINAEEFPDEKPESWISIIFTPKKFIPSAALAIIAIIILFVIKPGSTEIENPFNTRPRVRKDMIATTSQLSEQQKINNELKKMVGRDKIKDTLKRKQEIAKNGSQNNNENEFQTDEQNSPGFEVVSSPDFYSIDKSGLNFRQVNLSRSERIELNRLKENLIQFMKENNLK